MVARKQLAGVFIGEEALRLKSGWSWLQNREWRGQKSAKPVNLNGLSTQMALWGNGIARECHRQDWGQRLT
jgi:hypothetical protein